jgi:hypothetical protein
VKPILKIFVTEPCSGCSEARRLAAWATQNYTNLVVELVDLNQPDAVVPEAVFATPTYMLNDRIISLGNPSQAEVAEWVNKALALPFGVDMQP